MESEVMHSEDGYPVIHINKSTHRLRLENETDEGVDVVIERVGGGIQLDLSQPVHMTPAGEEDAHDLSPDCVCRPAFEEHESLRVYRHHTAAERRQMLSLI